MAKNPFEIERELEQARADYHAASTKETSAQLEKRSATIKKLMNDLLAVYATGANENPKGVKPFGMKKARGLYEVGNGQGLRSQGETPEEAVQNWNEGVYVKSTGPGVTVGKAE